MECSLENITVHYEEFGEGRPIVILPGWGSNTRLTAHDTEPCFQQRKGWKRIYIDPPGHGKTPGKDWITNQDKMLEIILACIDKLTAGQRFCLIGISLGGYLARGVRLYRAGLIDGMAMIVPVILAEHQKRTIPPYKVLVEDPIIRKQLTPFEAELFDMSIVQSQKWLDYLRTYPQVPEHENGDGEFLGKISEQPEKYAFSYDVNTVPEPFPGPSLIITGRQDATVGYRDAWNLLEKYPRATYVVLDRVGHLLEDSNALVQVLINNWLDRVEESVDLS